MWEKPRMDLNTKVRYADRVRKAFLKALSPKLQGTPQPVTCVRVKASSIVVRATHGEGGVPDSDSERRAAVKGKKEHEWQWMVMPSTSCFLRAWATSWAHSMNQDSKMSPSS